MRSLCLPIFAIVAIVTSAPVMGADEDFVKSSLAHEIIGPDQSMSDVQDFTEARIPSMPAVKTAAEWQQLAAKYRKDAQAKVLFRGAAEAWRQAKTKVEWQETLEGGPGYRVKKLRYEAIPGVWVPALLYEPEKLADSVPVLLNVDGHERNGKAADYKQLRCINQAKRGILALNVEWFGMGQLSTDGFKHGLINAIDLCGSSGIALHYLGMARGIDILLSQPHADPKRVGVTGLSGGGWQTIFISGLDDRVTFTDPVAGYSSFKTRVRHLSDLGDSEQTPCDLATVVDYSHLTAMMAPHPTLLTFNAKDNCCFASPHALQPLLDAAGPIFKLFGKEDNLRSHVNFEPGDHNYGLDNRQALYRMIGDHWFAGDSHFDAKEIPSDNEVKTIDQLKVELPADQVDFKKVALALSKDLPRAGDLPTDRQKAEAWQKEKVTALRRVLHPFVGQIQAGQESEEEKDGIRVARWKLRIGDAWTVPAVELTKGEPKGTAILISDKGRKDESQLVKRLLKEGKRVAAVDLYSFGEATVKSHGYLFSLLIGAVGERPIGVQVGELVMLSKLINDQRPDGPVTVVAVGPRSSTIALAAAAIEDGIAGVEVHDPLGSLKEPIEQGKEYSQNPELYCFGLLEVADVRQIAALVAPRPVVVKFASDRAKTEFGPLHGWYKTLGKEFNPLD